MVDLDAAFRELADAPEPAGLRSASGVRRRGDQRRRSTWAGAVVAVAILAVGTVAVVEAARPHAKGEGSTIPAASTDLGPSVLPSGHFLTAGDIPAIGPYADFRADGMADVRDPFRLPCGATPMAATDWSGIRQLEGRRFTSDLEATIIETTVLFDDEASAAAAAASFPAVCEPSASDRGSTIQYRPLPDLQGSQRGLVTIPKGDAGIGYVELAVARAGRIVVVLDWSSMGLPHQEDAESAQSWEWALPEDLVTRALDRATGR